MLEQPSDATDSAPAGAAEESYGGNLRLHNVLCPVDFGEPSERALRLAVWIASHYQSRLYVQHTFPELKDALTRGPGESLRIEDLPPELQSKEVDLQRMIEKA